MHSLILVITRKYSPLAILHSFQIILKVEHVNGVRVSGAGRKSGEWEWSGERRSKKMMERERSAELGSGNGAENGLNRALKDRSEVDPTVR